MKKIFNTFFILSMLLVLACSEEYEQATVTFYPTLETVLSEPAQGQVGVPYRIELLTSRVMARESQVNIRVEGNGSGYGYSYMTYPPMLEPGVITLTFPAGENKTHFDFTPLNDGLVEVNGYQYQFTIEQMNASIRSVGQGKFVMSVTEYPVLQLDYDFNDCSGTPSAFSERIVDGAMAATTWACTNFGYANDTPSAIEANAFGKGAGTSNAYLVMAAPIDGSLISRLSISMKVYSRFSGAGSIKVLYSTNYNGTGDPEADGVTWTEVEGTSAQMPLAGSRVWEDVSGMIEDVPDGPVYLAFQYAGGTGTSASNWRIDELLINGF